MSEKQIKSLVIKVSPSAEPPGVEYKWDILPQPEVFIKNIEIPDLNSDKENAASINLGTIVSGMPTAFARANLFRNALDNITDQSVKAKGLLSFYKQLISEWRGFISCIALSYSDLTIKRITLKYSDGKSIYETANIYEPSGAFGNVLFDRRMLWIDQTLSQQDPENLPFIDVISYKGKVIGGTSPDSFLFTSVSYKIEDRKPYLRNGKFIDPLESDLQPLELNVLYGYVLHIFKNIERFRKHFDGVDDYYKPNYANIVANLQDWIKSIEEYSVKKGWAKLAPQIPEIPSFNHPYSILFNHSTLLFGLNGNISTDPKTFPGAIQFDPKNLLLPKETEIAQFRFGADSEKKKEYLSDAPLLLLRADVKDEKDRYAYFTLPLTPLALNVFGENLADLVGIRNDSVIKSRLTAIYDQNDQDGEKLYVALKLATQGGDVNTFNIKYNVGKEIKGHDVVLWPNFISKQWNRYFLYSEMPHNDISFQVSPFIGLSKDEHFRIVFDEGGSPLLLAGGGKIRELPKDIEASLHIASNNAVADNKYKYEIYESNQPFKGLKFSYAGNDCGYAIIRYDIFRSNEKLPQNRLRDPIVELAQANLGIDFGSTNTSVAYYSMTNGVVKDEVILKNRRISLILQPEENNNSKTAIEKEVFFFQAENVRTNSLKSILTIHDPKRIVKDSENQLDTTALGIAIKGGFPNFEKTLPIESATENRYKLAFNRIGYAEVVYNMKWTDGTKQPAEVSYKKAYLGSLLLHIYAQLFEEGHQPVFLKWSYPSSMSTFLVGQYASIWSSLNSINPLVDGEPLGVANSPTGGNIITDNIFETNGPGQSQWDSNENSGVSSWGGGAAWGTSPSSPGLPSSNLQLSDPSKKIKFNFQYLSGTNAISEACAVANYLANSNLEKTPNYLTICFDIGGSTTDISALCMMKNQSGNLSLAMVKQNSIRFAAQRVASASRYAPRFKSVLLEVCERNELTIQGLNSEPINYSPELAPYYFEQIVDRLKEEDFPSFYQLLRANCPEMICINLYVTGLIMYYSGQLAYKLRNDIVNSEEGSFLKDIDPSSGGDWKPIINIVFAGKGARIFDWFKAIDPMTSNKYYTDLFIKGFGGIEIAKKYLFSGGYKGGPPIKINPTNIDNSRNLKYEVSKGLAFRTENLLIPQNDEAIEILGEENFHLIINGKMEKVPFDSSITPEMMENLGGLFLSSPPPGSSNCPKFMEFASIFFQMAKGTFGLKMTQQDFKDAFESMNINSYIKTLPEYRLAVENKAHSEKFDFVAPIIILEGMKFLEDNLLKGIQKI